MSHLGHRKYTTISCFFGQQVKVSPKLLWTTRFTTEAARTRAIVDRVVPAPRAIAFTIAYKAWNSCFITHCFMPGSFPLTSDVT